MFDGTFFKPLLGLSKPDLQKYLTYRGFDWRDDASNLTHKYKRNRVRLELMPVMYALAGGENALKDRLETMSRQSGDLRNWIESEVRFLPMC
jgi:tRNA(Ile)-lysidine synthase